MFKKKYYTGLQINEAIDGVVVDYKKAIEIYRRLAKMETDDLVPVVRCKYCRWKEQEQPGMVYCPATVGGWVDEDWFCKGGERSENERTD